MYCLQVTATHFCAGLIIKDGRCCQAAPILSWAVDKTEDWLLAYFRRKKWKFMKVDDHAKVP